MLLTFPSTHQDLYLIEEATGVLWFKAADVCSILGFSNPTAAISNHCPDDAKKIDYQSGRGAAALFVSEPGLYLLIMESRSRIASDFKQWLARTVLPQISKTGSFGNVPNVESEAAEFWSLIDGAIARGLDYEKVVGIHCKFTAATSKRKTKKISTAKSIASASAECLNQNQSPTPSSISAWVEDCLVFEKEARSQVGNDSKDVTRLFGSYCAYCLDRGIQPESLKRFSPAMLKQVEPKGAQKKHTSTGNFVVGVKLR